MSETAVMENMISECRRLSLDRESKNKKLWGKATMIIYKEVWYLDLI